MTMRLATAAGAGPDVRFFLPFSKVEEKGDGSVYVESVATAEVKDHHGEIVLHEGSVAAFSEWTEWAKDATGGESIGNIREMHERIGAGKAVKWTVDEAAKSNSLGLLVVDSEAAKKTKTRVYTGLSIGGDNVTREIREINGEKVPVITSYRLTEVSLVDKPACPVATFTMVKRLESKETPMEKSTPQLAEGEEIVRTIEAEGKPIGWLIRKTGDKGIPRAELAKDVSTSADAALAAVKQFMVDVLGMSGGTDIWTLDDAMSALRYMWFAATAAQAKESMGGIEMAITADLKKSETPADPPVTEDPPAETETDEKPKDAVTDPPTEAAAVPPAAATEDQIANAVKAALVPLTEKLSVIEKAIGTPVTATLEEKDAPDVVVKGDLAKIATTEDVAALSKKLDAIELLLKSLPAPPAGRAVHKTLGDGSGAGDINVQGLVKIAEDALAKAAEQGTSKSALDAMRLAFTTEVMKLL